jgi:polar amino acid transport system substrate-binding protein
MADDANRAWDVAFLATDPGREDRIAFTEPYLEIDSTYLVPAGSSLRSIEDIDQEDVRIAVSENSAYDLFLRRQLQHAQLVPAPGVDASNALFRGGGLEALAGLRPVLESVADELPGARVLEGRFTTVRQAIGTPSDREGAATYLDAFVQEAKASGMVAALIELNGIRGVAVAP